MRHDNNQPRDGPRQTDPPSPQSPEPLRLQAADLSGPQFGTRAYARALAGQRLGQARRARSLPVASPVGSFGRSSLRASIGWRLLKWGHSAADSPVVSRRRGRAIGAGLLIVVLMGGLALVTVRSQREARTQLEHRFELRNALGASFAHSYALSVLTAERRRAEASLTGRHVSERQFRGVVDALGLQAAVLLDRNGRLLQVWPPKPSGTQRALCERRDFFHVPASARLERFDR